MQHERFAALHLPMCAGETSAHAAPHSEPVAPPPAERPPAPAAKRRKTAAGAKDRSYLPGRGSANYAFLVCLLEVAPAPASGLSGWPGSDRHAHVKPCYSCPLARSCQS